MTAQSTRVTALVAVAAALTLFAFVVASPPQRHAPIGLTAQAGGVQALDDPTDADDDEQAQLAQQQAEQDMIESEQQAEQQNEAAQQQMQLDEQLAGQ